MFWDNFYSLCELKHTTPNAVCKKLDLSTATATHWKNGTMPKGDVLLNIANLLDCSVDYLLGREDTSQKINQVNNVDVHCDGNDINPQNHYIKSIDGISKEMLEEFEKLGYIDKVKVMSLIAELSEKEKV